MLKFPRPLHYAAWLALGATACSSDTIQRGAITLAMSTDMTVTADVKNVVLYVWRVDGAGRTLLRREEATLDPVPGASGLQRVRLPSTYVIESNDEPARVQARLVAFDGGDQATQMREVRTQVPRRDDNRVVRMPLLWVNQNNVTGPAFASENAGGVGTRNAGDADAEGMAYVARCGTDMTEDERGVCVSIDLARDEADLQRDEVKARMPLYAESGLEATMDENASCYDVSLAFPAPDAQGELPATVRRIAKGDVIPHDEGCSVALDADFPIERLNAAVLTRGAENGGFEAGAGWGEATFLRPLAAGSLFQRSADGRKLELPSAVCKRLVEDAVDSLLLSSTTTAWKGGESLCAAWNVASGARESGYDGAPPAPFDDIDAGVDAGPDGGPEPDGGPVTNEIVSRLIVLAGLGEARSLAIDGLGNEIGIAMTGSTATTSITARFDVGAAAAPVVNSNGPALVEPFVRAVRLGNRTEIYVGEAGEAQSQGVFHLPSTGGAPQPTMLTCQAPQSPTECQSYASNLTGAHVVQLGDGAALVWMRAAQFVEVSRLSSNPGEAHMARYSPAVDAALGQGRTVWPTQSWDREHAWVATSPLVAGSNDPGMTELFDIATGSAMRESSNPTTPALLSLHALDGDHGLLGRTVDGPYIFLRTTPGPNEVYWDAQPAWSAQPIEPLVSSHFATLPGGRVAMSYLSGSRTKLEWFKVEDGRLVPDGNRTDKRFAKLAIGSSQNPDAPNTGTFYAAFRCESSNDPVDTLQVRKIPWDKLDGFLEEDSTWGCPPSQL